MVLFTAAPALVAALVKAHADGRPEERLGFYAKLKLLIVDELGYRAERGILVLPAGVASAAAC